MTAGASLDVEMREAGQAQGILSEVRPVEVTEGEDGVAVETNGPRRTRTTTTKAENRAETEDTGKVAENATHVGKPNTRHC